MAKNELTPMSDAAVRKAMRDLRKKIAESWDVETVPFESYKDADVHTNDDIWLHVPDSNNRLVAGLRGYDGDILNMTISSTNRGAAGRLLLSSKKERLLCHKGHLGGNKAPVRMTDFLSEIEDCDIVEAENEDLAVIADLDSPRALSSISHFVRECLRIRTTAEDDPTPAPKMKSGYNPGPKDPQERRSATTRTRHYDAAEKLKEAVEKLGWLVVDREMTVSPDLLVAKGKKSALFEVKPNGELASFTMGIGELLVYSADVRPDIKIIVAQSPSDGSRDLVFKVLQENDIRLCIVNDDDSIPLENIEAALK